MYKSWIDESTPDDSLKVLTELACHFARKGGTQGERILNFIGMGDFLSVCDFDLDYSSCNAYEALNCRQAIGLLSKLKWLDLGRDRKAVAIEKFVEAEEACRQTNALFKLVAQGEVLTLEPWVAAVLDRARSKIAMVLGECPSLSELRPRFGPGATTLTKKKNASVVEKLQAGLSCSEDLVPYLSKVLCEMPAFCGLHSDTSREVKEELDSWLPFEELESALDDVLETTIDVAKSNKDYSRLKGEAKERLLNKELTERIRYLLDVKEGVIGKSVSSITECFYVDVAITNDIVEFVPKNAKTYRSICKGGSVNVMVQLAYGDEMTERLAAFGLDLSDQSKNQKLALEGSLTGQLATLDLSSASDTISIELVYHLLPVDWALALASCRSAKAVLEGKTITLEKFASMGNGYTFPLESLIFWALSSAASETVQSPNYGFASVYGDDIIVDTLAVPAVKHVLEVCGFTINVKKSYWTGPFRESCGADYYKGIDIRPVYQKELISPRELFRLHNFFVRQCDEETASLIRSLIPDHLCIYGPDGYGDGHLLGDWEPKRHKKWQSHGYGGVLFDTFKLSSRLDRRALRPGDRILPVYSTYIRENENRVTSPPSKEGRRLIGQLLCEKRLPQSLVERLVLSESIPERVSPVDGSHIKVVTYPGTEGYHRVSIYTFAS